VEQAPATVNGGLFELVHTGNGPSLANSLRAGPEADDAKIAGNRAPANGRIGGAFEMPTERHGEVDADIALLQVVLGKSKFRGESASVSFGFRSA
jgi:hypothetical protein